MIQDHESFCKVIPQFAKFGVIALKYMLTKNRHFPSSHANITPPLRCCHCFSNSLVRNYRTVQNAMPIVFFIQMIQNRKIIDLIVQSKHNLPTSITKIAYIQYIRNVKTGQRQCKREYYKVWTRRAKAKIYCNTRQIKVNKILHLFCYIGLFYKFEP